MATEQLLALSNGGTFNATETNVVRLSFAAGDLNAGDEFEIDVMGNKSGTTDAAYVNVRLGTTGTTADADLFTLPVNHFMPSSAKTSGGKYVFKFLSNTTARRVGFIGNGGSMASASPNSPAAAVTIPDISTNALYLTVTAYVGGSTDTLEIESCRVRLVKP